MFRHVVIGCDGAAGGRDAAVLGAAIASACGARLSLVGIFPTPLIPVPGMTDRRSLRAEATRTLRHERDAFAPGASVHTVADNSVPRALRHFAERWGADLVVIGSHPKTAAGRATISRRGRQLLAEAPFALGLAASGLHESPFAPASVGVGYDAGREAEEALRLAAALARASGARLVVRSVVDDRAPALTSADWREAVALSHDELWADQREQARAAAEAATAASGVPAEVSATVGDPGYELRDLSAHIDLMVVGSRRWGPVARLVTGGVGETLVSDAGCSLLIVPRPSAGRRRAAAAGHPVAAGAGGARS